MSMTFAQKVRLLRGQTSLEYLLLLAVVAVVVIAGFSKGSLIDHVQSTAGDYYNTVTRVIMGEKPNAVAGGWCSVTCPSNAATGFSVMYRACACPAPAFGGAYCSSGADSSCPANQSCNGPTVTCSSTNPNPGPGPNPNPGPGPSPGPCVPNCSGISCGQPDGCNGTCQGCPAGQSCVSGACVSCIPNCSACGVDNGCGGQCGCPAGDLCVSGQCQAQCNVTTQCPTINGCSSNNCGVSCGTCPAGEECSSLVRGTPGTCCTFTNCTVTAQCGSPLGIDNCGHVCPGQENYCPSPLSCDLNSLTCICGTCTPDTVCGTTSGHDDCGRVCVATQGSCPANSICEPWGECVTDVCGDCVPDTVCGTTSGHDSCGNVCLTTAGTCPSNSICEPWGECVTDVCGDCVPDTVCGTTSGHDSCGNVCVATQGSCPGNSYCTASGSCDTCAAPINGVCPTWSACTANCGEIGSVTCLGTPTPPQCNGSAVVSPATCTGTICPSNQWCSSNKCVNCTGPIDAVCTEWAAVCSQTACGASGTKACIAATVPQCGGKDSTQIPPQSCTGGDPVDAVCTGWASTCSATACGTSGTEACITATTPQCGGKDITQIPPLSCTGNTCSGVQSCINGQCQCVIGTGCNGNVCGPDACGNPNGCGTCSAGSQCSSGQCATCATGTGCNGKVCGPDACNNPNGCGSCTGATDTCVAGQCQCVVGTGCSGKICGQDACGNQNGCGTCSSGQQCTDSGQCSTTITLQATHYGDCQSCLSICSQFHLGGTCGLEPDNCTGPGCPIYDTCTTTDTTSGAQSCGSCFTETSTGSSQGCPNGVAEVLSQTISNVVEDDCSTSPPKPGTAEITEKVICNP